MGYYIYHNKLILEKPSTGLGTELDKDLFKDSDLELFSKYFQRVTTEEYVDAITLCEDQNMLEQARHNLNYNQGIFLKNDTKAIEKYLAHKKYNLLHKKETLLNNGWLNVAFFKYKTVDGFYHKNVFQHTFNDINGNFYVKYAVGKKYSELTVFEEACDIQFSPYRFEDIEEYKETKKLFVDHLVDQYEYGSSLLAYF